MWDVRKVNKNFEKFVKQLIESITDMILLKCIRMLRFYFASVLFFVGFQRIHLKTNYSKLYSRNRPFLIFFWAKLFLCKLFIVFSVRLFSYSSAARTDKKQIAVGCIQIT